MGKRKRVLITGGLGFVGRQITRSLVGRELEISIVVRDTDKLEKILSNNEVDKIIVTKDLFAERLEWWVEQLQDIDIVIHAAWYVEHGQYLLSPNNLDCLQGSLNIAKAARKAGVRRVIGIGTCFEYDLSLGLLSVDTPLKPTTPYAGSKVALYTALSTWLPKMGIEFVWCRLFYLYGEAENSNRLVPYLHSKLRNGEVVELTSGTQIRDFLDVSVAGKRIADISLSSTTGAVNICSGVPVTVRQLAEKIADEYGRPDLLKFGAREDNFVDPPCVVGI